MYKLLISSLLPYVLLATSNFSNLSEKDLFTEPSLCQKIYNDCLDECESKNTQNSFTSCLSDCSTLFEKCEEKKDEGKEIDTNCKDLYKTCSFECEKESTKIVEDGCFTKCEESYDKCINESN